MDQTKLWICGTHFNPLRNVSCGESKPSRFVLVKANTNKGIKTGNKIEDGWIFHHMCQFNEHDNLFSKEVIFHDREINCRNYTPVLIRLSKQNSLGLVSCKISSQKRVNKSTNRTRMRHARSSPVTFCNFLPLVANNHKHHMSINKNFWYLKLFA